MDGPLPFSALLSHALVAFTIEFDNEFEHQVPHRTTNHGSTGGSQSVPWLVSMVMWVKFMQFVPDDGISVIELKRLSRLSGKEMRIWLTRMSKWWGYVVVEPDAAGLTSKQSSAALNVRPTPGGRKALEVWRPLTGIIEKRWDKRFGADIVDRLRECLKALAEKMNGDLPDYLPILGYEMFSEIGDHKQSAAESGAAKQSSPDDSLLALFSKILMAFAIEFERDSTVSLAISANVLRLIGPNGVPVRDLRRLSAVSKEAIAMCMARLEERGFALVQPESPCSRTKILFLTPKGRQARSAYYERTGAIEEQWRGKFGEDTIRNLRQSLELLLGEPSASPLFRGLEPYPDGWRAAVQRTAGLPHYPMVLHRGGFPDGS